MPNLQLCFKEVCGMTAKEQFFKVHLFPENYTTLTTRIITRGFTKIDLYTI